mgnify:CR=1 FL=1
MTWEEFFLMVYFGWAVAFAIVLMGIVVNDD